MEETPKQHLMQFLATGSHNHNQAKKVSVFLYHQRNIEILKL